ncbi:PREDICTED: putative F-box protein At5g15660 [Camelina sativa]|uniref:F-box protein At5g15660 n=1 Tax=Camelina sativa TaxID=90675 RepID=A0ABM1REB9_CAMSA|nr:PREDICTED: putative F-box protein At5g15660 [Camelina sativa]
MRYRKKTKTVHENIVQTSEERANFDELPHDLEIEIFGRLPLKSLARFLTVSKLWATTIRSPDFIRSYPRGSSWQPRTLIAADFNSHGSRGAMGNLHFFKRPSSSSPKSFISRLTCPVKYDHQHLECFYHHVNGLISVGYGQEQIVFNPITGKSITLPRARTRRKLVKSFFGYDPVSDEFKVVCMTEKMYGRLEEPSSEHQVLTFTLGVKKSWQMINCSVPHRPWSNGVCINGVVYYVARTGAEMSHMRLMRFALRPGDSLDIFTSLPEEINKEIESSIYYLFLINYEGKVAIPTNTSLYTYDVWVMNQEGGKHEWLKKITFSIEPWKRLFDYLYVRGATHTGEIILAPTHYSNAYYIFHYNPDKKSFRKIGEIS